MDKLTAQQIFDQQICECCRGRGHYNSKFLVPLFIKKSGNFKLKCKCYSSRIMYKYSKETSQRTFYIKRLGWKIIKTPSQKSYFKKLSLFFLSWKFNTEKDGQKYHQS